MFQEIYVNRAFSPYSTDGHIVISTPKDVKARLHGSPGLINTVESMKLNSTVERYLLHGSTKVNEAVDFKMAANELVREGVVICDYLRKECQHILEKKK